MDNWLLSFIYRGDDKEDDEDDDVPDEDEFLFTSYALVTNLMIIACIIMVWGNLGL